MFSEFLEDISADDLPNEDTHYRQSKVWNMLYDFQKDAALAIINKLERYNGCILADSVGLGKTFTALAVVKYCEGRNKSVEGDSEWMNETLGAKRTVDDIFRQAMIWNRGYRGWDDDNR